MRERERGRFRLINNRLDTRPCVANYAQIKYQPSGRFANEDARFDDDHGDE